MPIVLQPTIASTRGTGRHSGVSRLLRPSANRHRVPTSCVCPEHIFARPSVPRAPKSVPLHVPSEYVLLLLRSVSCAGTTTGLIPIHLGVLCVLGNSLLFRPLAQAARGPRLQRYRSASEDSTLSQEPSADDGGVCASDRRCARTALRRRYFHVLRHHRASMSPHMVTPRHVRVKTQDHVQPLSDTSQRMASTDEVQGPLMCIQQARLVVGTRQRAVVCRKWFAHSGPVAKTTVHVTRSNAVELNSYRSALGDVMSLVPGKQVFIMYQVSHMALKLLTHIVNPIVFDISLLECARDVQCHDSP